MRKSILESMDLDEDTPKFIREDLLSMFDDSSSSSNSSNLSSGIKIVDSDASNALSTDSDEEDIEVERIITEEPKAFASRRYYTKRNQYESNWYKRYLANDEIGETLKNDPTHRDTKEFKGLFRIDYKIFLDIVTLYLANGWYDIARTDVCGNICSDIHLLILGVLHTLGHAASRFILHTPSHQFRRYKPPVQPFQKHALWGTFPGV